MRTKYVGTVDLMGETDAYKKIGQRIRDARMSHPNRYTQKELGDVLGYNQSNMSKMERGERRISLPDLKKLADFLGKPLSYFIDDIDGLRLDPKFALVMTNLDFTVVPVYASVNAGGPSFVMNEPDFMTFPRELLQSATFGVRVRGDSMIGAGVHDGDILLVRPQDTADHGDIVVARVNDEEYTIKRLRLEGGQAILEPANPAYEPIVANDLHIVGKVVGLHRKF